MHIIIEQIATENGHARSILHVPRNFEIFHDRLIYQVWGTTLPLLLFKDFRYQFEI